MSDQKVIDAWDRASNPTTFSNKFWGEIHIDCWLCALVKGVGKVPFDPAVHKQPATAIDMSIFTLPEMNITNAKITERNMIAESTEWSKIVWASLKTLGLTNLKDANGRFALCETVPTGQTYEKDGQTKERTTFKFLQLFASESECRADYVAQGGNPSLESTLAPDPTPAATPVQPPAGNGNGAEKAAAFQFAKVIVNNVMKSSVGKPLDEVMTSVGKKLAEYPTVNKFFTSDSPEVVELMMNGGEA